MTMVLTAASARSGGPSGAEVSRVRMWVLRAMYLLLVVGLGLMIVPEIVSHELTSRGVIAALLGGVWLLAYGLPQWSAGQFPPTFAEDMFNIGVGVVIMPFVIPWGYVWRHYVKAPAERWR
jgi:hypothetical protein